MTNFAAIIEENFVNKREKSQLFSKMHYRFCSFESTRSRFKTEGADNNYSDSHSSAQETVSIEKGILVEQEKEAKSEQTLHTLTVVQCKLPSLTIGCTSKQYCSSLTFSKVSYNQQTDVEQKLDLLQQRRISFQKGVNKKDHFSASSLESVSDSENSASIKINRNFVKERKIQFKGDFQNRIESRPPRHISVRKFDTFSTFEGTFDEDTGVGYLTGVDEERTGNIEDFHMMDSNYSQDSMTLQNTVPATINDKREHLYKILVIGELGTGKTSIIKRYVHQFFSQHYRATIGVDFALKVLNWDPQTIIRLQLWDIAGQERFGNMTRVYYKEAVGAFIVFDVTRSATLDAVIKWKQDLDSKVQLPDGSLIPCILLANKCDQQKEGLVNSTSKMDEYCKEKKFNGWFETSAKENINIEEAARFLVNKILQNDELLKGKNRDTEADGDKFILSSTSVDRKLCAC